MSKERGFSLVELMVAMTVTLIVSGAIYGLLTSGSNAFRREPELADRQQNIRVAMDLISRDVYNAGASCPRTRRCSREWTPAAARAPAAGAQRVRPGGRDRRRGREPPRDRGPGRQGRQHEQRRARDRLDGRAVPVAERLQRNAGGGGAHGPAGEGAGLPGPSRPRPADRQHQLHDPGRGPRQRGAALLGWRRGPERQGGSPDRLAGGLDAGRDDGDAGDGRASRHPGGVPVRRPRRSLHDRAERRPPGHASRLVAHLDRALHDRGSRDRRSGHCRLHRVRVAVAAGGARHRGRADRVPVRGRLDEHPPTGREQQLGFNRAPGAHHALRASAGGEPAGSPEGGRGRVRTPCAGS